jgi:hypothetical protein
MRVFPVTAERVVAVVGRALDRQRHQVAFPRETTASLEELASRGISGEELLRRLETSLSADQEPRLLALAVAEVDLAHGLVRVTSAGTVPAVLLLPDGRIQELSSPSPPMGDVGWMPATVEQAFPANSRLVLVSVGAAAAGEPEIGSEEVATLALGAAQGSVHRLEEVLLNGLADLGRGVSTEHGPGLVVISNEG